MLSVRLRDTSYHDHNGNFEAIVFTKNSYEIRVAIIVAVCHMLIDYHLPVLSRKISSTPLIFYIKMRW